MGDAGIMATLKATTVTGTITATAGFTGASSLTNVAISQFTTGTLPEALLPPGSIVGTTHYSNSTRNTSTAAATRQIYTFNITKKLGTSVLHVEGVMPLYGTPANNGSGSFCVFVDNTAYYVGVTADTADHWCGSVNWYTYISGIAAGTRTIGVGWSANNGSSILPVNIINPNSSDNAYNRQTGTQIHVTEIAQ
jgi:hypothetical protein